MAKKIIFLPSCHSTNEIASQLLETDDIPDGTVVITNEQTKGKGQRGNTWESQKEKNLTFSIILKPHFIEVSDQFNLNMVVSLGIAEALNTYKKGFLVKWPNDIYYKRQKVCGILIQNNIKGKTIDTAVIGIGINVNQESFSEPKAISLKKIIGNSVDLQEVLNEVLFRVERRYLHLKEEGFYRLKKDYIDNLYRFGESHLYKAEKVFNGQITGVSDDGQLEIDTSEGVRRFLFKEVEFIDN